MYIFAAIKKQLNTTRKEMKKFLLMIATVALIAATVSCGNDDEPERDKRVFTANEAMINHAYNTKTDAVLGMSATRCKLTVDTKNLTASLELTYNDGQGEKTLTLDDLKATTKDESLYKFSSASLSSLSGYVDLSQATSMRFRFTTSDGVRIISTTPEVFFLKNNTTIVYDDTTKTSTSEEPNYQFTIQPTGKTATVQVMNINHDKDLKYFESITANNVPITVTRDGFTISGNNLPTTAIYRAYDFETGSSTMKSDKYPFKTFNATVDMANDHLDATFMIGGSATVTATGSTYPDYRIN